VTQTTRPVSGITHIEKITYRKMQLVLSLFSGIDLFGRAFQLESFCVVSAGDLITGQDIRNFHAPKDKFDGIIGGSPCQDFSMARRSDRLRHFDAP
jgi:site-specific DNA-cytosine methylase